MLGKLFTKLQSVQGRNDLKYAMARTLINPMISRAGFCLLTDHFYQPIPSRSEVLKNKERKRFNSAINWKADQQVELLTLLFKNYSEEFNQESLLERFGYKEYDSGVKAGDSHVLYASVRNYKPKCIIEIGSGGSSQIMMSALSQNYLHTGSHAEFISIDPFTSEKVKSLKSTAQDHGVRFSVINKIVQEVPLETFDQLQSGDILFVDSSHVFKTGSDVEFEFMQIYPRLKPGVIVHIHDVFFPFDYPAEWFTTYSRFWNEQYILEAFLQFNKKFEVLLSLSMLADTQPSIFHRSIRGYQSHTTPGSFWMKVCNEPTDG